MRSTGVDVGKDDDDDAFSGYRDGDARLGDFSEHVCGDKGLGRGLRRGGRLFLVLGS